MKMLFILNDPPYGTDGARRSSSDEVAPATLAGDKVLVSEHSGASTSRWR
jgi:hypothetical protein